MNPPTQAEKLRTYVVLTVLIGVLLLAFGIYGLIGTIVLRSGADAVPDAMWLAAGTYGGALVTWLLNSKGGTDATPAGTPSDPLTVKTSDQPLDVTPVPAGPSPTAGDLDMDGDVGAGLPVVPAA